MPRHSKRDLKGCGTIIIKDTKGPRKNRKNPKENIDEFTVDQIKNDIEKFKKVLDEHYLKLSGFNLRITEPKDKKEYKRIPEYIRHNYETAEGYRKSKARKKNKKETVIKRSDKNVLYFDELPINKQIKIFKKENEKNKELNELTEEDREILELNKKVMKDSRKLSKQEEDRFINAIWSYIEERFKEERIKEEQKKLIKPLEKIETIEDYKKVLSDIKKQVEDDEKKEEDLRNKFPLVFKIVEMTNSPQKIEDDIIITPNKKEKPEEEKPARKRGRPKGSKNKNKTEEKKVIPRVKKIPKYEEFEELIKRFDDSNGNPSKFTEEELEIIENSDDLRKYYKQKGIIKETKPEKQKQEAKEETKPKRKRGRPKGSKNKKIITKKEGYDSEKGFGIKNEQLKIFRKYFKKR